MLQTILSLLGLLPKALGTIDNITNAIANEKIEGLRQTTQQAQIASAERVSLLQAQRDALIAESNRSKAPIYVQSTLASIVIIVLAKLMVWDKVVASFVGCNGHTEPGTCMMFNTDLLDPNMWWMMMAVVGFYTLHSFKDR